MSDISVLGLGLMGSALARALQQGGHTLTVWNRSPAKMQSFIEDGATGASDVVEAVTASPVILVCVDNYSVTQSILGAEYVVSYLSGRTVIQLSTGTPQEARDSIAWMEDRGTAYIDGAILAGPDNLGTAGAQILFAGPAATFAQVEPLVRSLCGNIRYLGENIGAAATLDLAWLSRHFGMILGVAHGARLCESEDVGVDLYATIIPEGEYARELAETIHTSAYANPNATLCVWEAVLRRIQRQALDAEINNEIPEFMSGLFKRAIAAGYGEEDVAALVKVLRGNRPA